MKDSANEYILAQEEFNDNMRELDSLITRLNMATITLETTEVDSLALESSELLSKFIDYDVSTEDAEMDNFKAKVKDVYETVNKLIFTKFKSLSPLVNKTSEFKLNEINSLLEQINSGALVPAKNIDENKVKAFNNKLAPFYASGYNVETSCKDLISYFESIADLSNKTGKYFKGLESLHKELASDDRNINVTKTTGIMNVKTKLNGLKEAFERKYRISDFRLSVINDWYGNTVDLFCVSHSNRRGVKAHTDSYTTNAIKGIRKVSTTDTIKMLEYATKHQSKLNPIHSGISFMLKKMGRENAMGLLSSSMGDESGRRFLVARYNEGVIRLLINLYKNNLMVDSIIIAYVKLAYEKNKESAGTVKVDTTK